MLAAVVLTWGQFHDRPPSPAGRSGLRVTPALWITRLVPASAETVADCLAG
jgi:hypothetical protein